MFTHFNRQWPLIVALALMLFSVSSHSDTGTKNGFLTLSQVLARVLRDSPSLQSYPFYLRADEARALQAQKRPNPELSLELENIGGSGSFESGEQLETTLALSQVIEMGDKREQRRQVSNWHTRNRQVGYELARIDALAQASAQFIRVARTQWQHQFAQQHSAWAKAAAEAAQKRFEAGRISEAEAGQARAEAMRAALDIEKTQTQLRAEKIQLATYWGSSLVDFDAVSVDLFKLRVGNDYFIKQPDGRLLVRIRSCGFSPLDSLQV